MNTQLFPYEILPLQFMRMPRGEVILVNSAGEFIFLNADAFEAFVSHKMNCDSEIFLDLKGKHFVTDTELAPIVDLLATKYRTKKAFLKNFTALHMVVITLRCNHCCRYCHASSESPESTQWDMSPSIARKVVDMIFQSPSPEIKIEFQGGEPLLNWRAVKEIVEYAEKLNESASKRLEFVICTNLTLMTEEIVHYLKNHNVLISTSLDGPKDLHDKNRILRKGESSYDLFAEKLAMMQEIMGKEHVSALMTTTKHSLQRIREVVDEYLKRGFSGIFLRALNPYGFAKTDHKLLDYKVEEFIGAYKESLDYIIKLNLEGVHFEEYYTALLLSRILTPFCTGFMDLQSPAGTGICGVIYDYNGDVYPSDEARMLAKMGNRRFYLGNVEKDPYLKIFGGSVLQKMISKSNVETLAGCAWCAFQQYCGADPVRNYAEQGDIVGHRPTSDFCRKNMGTIKFLFELIRENDEGVMDVFWSWITKRRLEEVRGVELPGETT